jgi:cytochrome o ubiquinol oxidase operon protein cyoD
MSVENSCSNIQEQDKSIKTLKSYLIGFGCAIILTLIAFYISAAHILSGNLLYLVLIILAVIQLFVQSMFFLRLNASAEGRWDLMPFLFTCLILLVIVLGSLWIMNNLNYFMGS